MTLHIFNPEHDIALASDLENFTAPHAGRQLRHDLGWLPALWADETDTVLVDNEETAQKSLDRLSAKLVVKPKACLTSAPKLSDVTEIIPWGWNSALRSQLLKRGILDNTLPSKDYIAGIRQLSHRRTSSEVLSAIRNLYKTTIGKADRLVGESYECFTFEDLSKWMNLWRKTVLKAPWSSSGRGIRFVETTISASLEGWLRNTFNSQGAVMAEPYYKKEKDFGMEFEALQDGTIKYLGLSLFHTMNGAYTGNILATEEQKQEMLNRYIPNDLLKFIEDNICQILSSIFKDRYIGPFGVDMMIIASEKGFLVHPCVEINLRRTMGHVALALTKLINPKNDGGIVRVMRIIYENNQYKLKLQQP